VGVSLDHLAFVCNECGEHVSFLGLGNVEVVERSRKLGRDLVEDFGRDLQCPMGLFEAGVSAVWFRRRTSFVRM
jgi:hypothetical protein